MSNMHLANKEKLMNDLQMVIADTEELLRMTADQVGEGAEGIRTRVTARLHQATTELSQLQQAAIEQVKDAGHAADEFVHENPWKSVGVAAGIGLVIGMLISRR
jgi:ElaB/YqjD/DUF883 family membrane-anchored ribosome-binding protein